MSMSAQIFGLALVALYLIVIVRMVRGRKLRAKYSFLWLIVGAVVLVLSAAPGLLDWLATTLGIFYSPALLFLIAIMFLMFVAVHFSWEISRLEDRTRTLAEELALAQEELRVMSRQQQCTISSPHPVGD